MFITVPLLIVAVAFIALVFVVWRKWPFLKKLEPDAHSVGESFVHDLAPEAIERARRVDWRAFWHQGLQGIEELLKVFRKAFDAVGQGRGWAWPFPKRARIQPRVTCRIVQYGLCPYQHGKA